MTHTNIQIEQASKWFAGEVDILTCINDSESAWFLKSTRNGLTADIHQGEWTITDPRCREVVREKFRIITDISANYFSNGYRFAAHQHLETQRFFGKSIESVEISCLMAIYEERSDER